MWYRVNSVCSLSLLYVRVTVVAALFALDCVFMAAGGIRQELKPRAVRIAL